MRRIRFMSGEGNGEATIPDGQLLSINMVPGANADGSGGSWIQVNESKAIWVPGKILLFKLTANELGAFDNPEHRDGCDEFPGNTQIQIVFGQNVQRPPDANPDMPTIGNAPLSWWVVYNGAW